MRSSRPFLLLLALAAVAPGCGISMRVRRGDRVESTRVSGSAQTAAERAEREIPCALENLTLEDLSGGGYRISGCGTTITYTCVGSICAPSERSSGMSAAATSGTGGRPTWSDAQVRQLQTAIYEPVVACMPQGTDSVSLQLAISPQGEVRRVGARTVDATVAACIDAALARGRMGGSVSAARTVLMSFRRAALAQAVGAPASEPHAPPPSPGIAPTTESTVRAAIDARTPALLACVEAEALSMQVSWTGEGRLDALLRGERQGTPEEACVRAIVQQLSIAAPGAPGTIVHAVQR